MCTCMEKRDPGSGYDVIFINLDVYLYRKSEIQALDNDLLYKPGCVLLTLAENGVEVVDMTFDITGHICPPILGIQCVCWVVACYIQTWPPFTHRTQLMPTVL